MLIIPGPDVLEEETGAKIGVLEVNMESSIWAHVT